MYPFLLQAHSGFRYIVLLLIVATLALAAVGLFGRRPFTDGVRKLGLAMMTSAQIQLVLGLLLYFVSPRVHAGDGHAMATAETRYWTVEHISTNIIAIVLFTLAYSLSKRASTDAGKYSRLFWWTLGGIVVLTASLYANSHAPGLFGKAS